jgi:hypothetical protein
MDALGAMAHESTDIRMIAALRMTQDIVAVIAAKTGQRLCLVQAMQPGKGEISARTLVAVGCPVSTARRENRSNPLSSPART